jgi:hypothetical protein
MKNEKRQENCAAKSLLPQHLHNQSADVACKSPETSGFDLEPNTLQ